MAANKGIVISGVVVGGIALLTTYSPTFQKSATVRGRILLGTYVFILLLSALDTLGGGASQIATGLALTAALASLLSGGAAVLQQLGVATSGAIPPVTDTTPGQKGPR